MNFVSEFKFLYMVQFLKKKNTSPTQLMCHVNCMSVLTSGIHMKKEGLVFTHDNDEILTLHAEGTGWQTCFA